MDTIEQNTQRTQSEKSEPESVRARQTLAASLSVQAVSAGKRRGWRGAGGADHRLSSGAGDEEGLELQLVDFAGAAERFSRRRDAAGELSQSGDDFVGWADGGYSVLGAARVGRRRSRCSRLIARIWGVRCVGLRNRSFFCVRAMGEPTMPMVRAPPGRRSGGCLSTNTRWSVTR